MNALWAHGTRFLNELKQSGAESASKRTVNTMWTHDKRTEKLMGKSNVSGFVLPWYLFDKAKYV